MFACWNLVRSLFDAFVPSVHSQVYLLGPSVHLAPFLHGVLAHSSMSIWQRFPVKPGNEINKMLVIVCVRVCTQTGLLCLPFQTKTTHNPEAARHKSPQQIRNLHVNYQLCNTTSFLFSLSRLFSEKGSQSGEGERERNEERMKLTRPPDQRVRNKGGPVCSAQRQTEPVASFVPPKPSHHKAHSPVLLSLLRHYPLRSPPAFKKSHLDL